MTFEVYSPSLITKTDIQMVFPGSCILTLIENYNRQVDKFYIAQTIEKQKYTRAQQVPLIGNTWKVALAAMNSKRHRHYDALQATHADLRERLDDYKNSLGLQKSLYIRINDS